MRLLVLAFLTAAQAGSPPAYTRVEAQQLFGQALAHGGYGRPTSGAYDCRTTFFTVGEFGRGVPTEIDWTRVRSVEPRAQGGIVVREQGGGAARAFPMSPEAAEAAVSAAASLIRSCGLGAPGPDKMLAFQTGAGLWFIDPAEITPAPGGAKRVRAVLLASGGQSAHRYAFEIDCAGDTHRLLSSERFVVSTRSFTAEPTPASAARRITGVSERVVAQAACGTRPFATHVVEITREDLAPFLARELQASAPPAQAAGPAAPNRPAPQFGPRPGDTLGSQLSFRQITSIDGARVECRFFTLSQMRLVQNAPPADTVATFESPDGDRPSEDLDTRFSTSAFKNRTPVGWGGLSVDTGFWINFERFVRRDAAGRLIGPCPVVTGARISVDDRPVSVPMQIVDRSSGSAGCVTRTRLRPSEADEVAFLTAIGGGSEATVSLDTTAGSFGPFRFYVNGLEYMPVALRESDFSCT